MSSVETVSALERRLNDAIPQQAFRSVFSARLKDIGRNVKIAGFRPGKVPVKIIEQYYGAQAEQEALSDAIQRSFNEATQTNKLKVVGKPQFEIKTKDLSAEQIEYSATFEVYPDIDLGDLSKITVERLVYEVTQADVDSTIATLRKQRSTFEATDRAAQAEDQVNIDFTGKLDGVVFEGGEAKDYTFILGAGRMLPEFEAAITGMKVGATKSFDMVFPENYHGKDVAGKKVTFTITVNQLAAPKLPEVDAEFAKSVGIADGDTSKLLEEIRVNLEREVARRLKVRNKNATMDALLQVSTFEVPKVSIEQEVEELMQQSLNDMKSRGMATKGVSLPAEMFMESAERRVKLGLILADRLENFDLRAKPEQIKAMIHEYAQTFDQPEEVVRWYASDARRMQEARGMVLEENLMVWTLSQVNTVDKPAVFSELMSDK